MSGRKARMQIENRVMKIIFRRNLEEKKAG